MKSRIDKIKNFYPDEKFENLDNKKLLNNIHNIYNRAKEEFNILNNKITDKLEYDKKKFLSNVDNYKKDVYKLIDDENINFIQNKKQIQEKIEKEKSQGKSALSLSASTYNEILKEREEEYKAIYE